MQLKLPCFLLILGIIGIQFCDMCMCTLTIRSLSEFMVEKTINMCIEDTWSNQGKGRTLANTFTVA